MKIAIQLLSIALLTGCGLIRGSANISPPLIFSSLNLESTKPNGNRDWSLKSPEARYDHSRRMVRVLSPTGIIYNNNEPSFSISSNIATIINDGELIILEGKVIVRQLSDRKALITGDRLRWEPRNSIITIDRRPHLRINPELIN